MVMNLAHNNSASKNVNVRYFRQRTIFCSNSGHSEQDIVIGNRSNNIMDITSKIRLHPAQVDARTHRYSFDAPDNSDAGPAWYGPADL